MIGVLCFRMVSQERLLEGIQKTLTAKGKADFWTDVIKGKVMSGKR